MIKASRTHLADVGESYFEHLLAASRIALLMIRAGIACGVHAIVPAICTTTASRCLGEVQDLFESRHAARLKNDILQGADGRLLGS
jgi:hypothetical protein